MGGQHFDADTRAHSREQHYRHIEHNGEDMQRIEPCQLVPHESAMVAPAVLAAERMAHRREETAVNKAETHAHAVHELIVLDPEVADDHHDDGQQLQRAQGLQICLVGFHINISNCDRFNYNITSAFHRLGGD